MHSSLYLRVPFAINALVLLAPVQQLLLGTSSGGVFGGAFEESEGMRMLIGSLYGGVLACSLLAQWQPRLFAGLLVFQVVYKSIWLSSWVLPRVLAGQPIPTQLTVSFVAMVLAWPALLWKGLSRPAGDAGKPKQR